MAIHVPERHPLGPESVSSDIQAGDIRWAKLEELPGGGITSLVVAPSNPNILYASINTNAMGVWKSEDAGRTWRKISPGDTSIHNLGMAVHPKDHNYVIFSHIHGGINLSTDGGKTWTRVREWFHEGIDQVRVFKFSPANPDIIYAGALNGTIFKSTDKGRTWNIMAKIPQPEGPSPFAGIAWIEPSPKDPAVAYAITNVGTYKTQDGGKSWEKLSDRVTGTDLEIDPSNPNVMYAAVCTRFTREGCAEGGVMKSRDEGRNWAMTRVGPRLEVHDIALAPSDPKVIYAATHDGIYKSTNGGDTWSRTAEGLGYLDIGTVAAHPINPDVAFAGTGMWWWTYWHGHKPVVASPLEGIYKTEDGKTWSKSDKGFFETDVIFVAVDPRNPAVVYGGTDCSRGIFKTVDGGLTWVLMPGGTTESGPLVHDAPHYTMQIRVPTSQPNALYVSSRFGLIRTWDAGRTWEGAFPHRAHLHGFDLASDPNIIYMGVAAEEDATIPAENRLSHMYKSVDGGRTWQLIDTGFPAGRQDVGPHWVVVDPRNPDVAYVALSSYEWRPGYTALGVYKTSDGGRSWRPITNGLTSMNVISLAIHPKETGILYAGTDRGVFKTADGGQRWVEASTALRAHEVFHIIVNPANPDIVYIGTNKGVLRSTDSGKSWKDVSTGLFNRGPTYFGTRGSGHAESLAIDANGRILYLAIPGTGVFSTVKPVSESLGGFRVTVLSNSATKSFVLDRANKQLAVSVSGPTGGSGFAYVIFPKAMLGGPYTIQVDDRTVGAKVTEDEENTVIYVEYAVPARKIVVTAAR